MLGADVLLMLTDTAGVFTADPRRDDDASLIEEIVEVDAALEKVAGGAGTERGSGGMASKLAAAKIAAWSGVRAVIASAALPGVVTDAIAGRPVGTSFAPRAAAAAEPQALDRVRARASEGRIVVDAGARRALVERRQVVAARRACASVDGAFDAEATVEIVDTDGAVFAKGLSPLHVAAARGVPRPARPPISPTAPPRGRPPRRPRRAAVGCSGRRELDR